MARPLVCMGAFIYNCRGAISAALRKYSLHFKMNRCP